ncbi:hypothetical protein [Niveibacterium sp.]|uniref:hypothetical protein n=1 Tax=Niveibacterium sp. TaxID=2017444 RepID=UPI0035B47AD0
MAIANDTGTNPRGYATAANALPLLLEKAKDTLSDADLEWLASTDEQALCELGQLAATLEKIGLLASCEGNDKPRSGCLESGDAVAGVLFLASNVIANAQATLEISRDADFMLSERIKAAARSPEPEAQ